MSFVVEDGTGVVGANSFTTVQFADDYFADSFNAAWTGDNNAKQGALVRATRYICLKYGNRFLSNRLFLDSSLPFPRMGYNPAMPIALQQATAEYAVRALSSDLFPDIISEDNGQLLISKTDTVGPISTSRTYKGSSSNTSWKKYPSADFLMRDLIIFTQGKVYR